MLSNSHSCCHMDILSFFTLTCAIIKVSKQIVSPRRIYTICNYGICKRQNKNWTWSYSEKDALKRPSSIPFINSHPIRNPKILCSEYQGNHNIHLLILMKSAAPNSKLRIMNCSTLGRNIQEHNHLDLAFLFGYSYLNLVTIDKKNQHAEVY